MAKRARNWRNPWMLAALASVVVFVVFDIRLRPVFSLPREIERQDPAQEARYERCVDERTDEATRLALESADNPDVQSLMIRMQQKEAIDECRREYPERRITISEPMRFNVIDLSFRFGEQ